jgi:hypothetical protein
MQPALNIVLGKENRVRIWAVSDRMFMEMLNAWKEKYDE